MNKADERAADEYYSLLGTYIRELSKAHKGIRRLVRRNRRLEAENYDFRHNKIKIISFHDRKDRIINDQLALTEQLVRDLNSAHDEIMTLQGLDPKTHDWPEWTTQANSIRAAERMLMKRLAKTDAWTEFPDGETND